MPNETGRNGYGEKDWPTDEVLTEFFTSLAYQYAGRGVPVELQLELLKTKLGLDIKRTKLFETRKRLQIPSVRLNPTPMEAQLEALHKSSESNPSGTWGVTQTRGRLAQEGVLVTRQTVRDFNVENHPEEVAQRMASTGRKVPRKPLNLLGPFHQIHWDGHEKMSWQALKLSDDVGICIYGGRCSQTIGHLFLDWIAEENYVLPLTVITDKGSEVGEMLAIQSRLRSLAAPDLDQHPEHPPHLQVKSVHNTPIEGLWRWHRDADGRDIKGELLNGTHFYDADIPYHRFLFYWVWVPVIQDRLDKYRAYYNAHPIQKQRAKLAPTGAPPDLLSLSPSSFDSSAVSKAIPVQPAWVDEERMRLGGMEARERLFQWYPLAFHGLAHDAWVKIGSPERKIENCWSIFAQMSLILKDLPVVWNA